MLIPLLTFFYMFPASLIFLYGIGLERLSMNVHSNRMVISSVLKMSVSMLVSASLAWFVSMYVLYPNGLAFLIPLFSLTVSYRCEYLLALVCRSQVGYSHERERLFSCGIVIFALYNALGYIELLLIVISACLGMIIWSFVLHAVKIRLDESKMGTHWKDAPLILISLGIIALTLYAWDNAWIMSMCNF